MNRTADRHRAPRSRIAVLGAIAVVLAGTAPYAMAQDKGQDHRTERRAIPERPPARQAPVAHQHGPANLNSEPQAREHGPANFNRGPQPREHGSANFNRGPQPREHGPAVVGRRPPERFENHGPPGFRDRPRDRDHDYFDDRYNHGRYYPRRGEVVRVLPFGYRPFYYERRPYFFVGGVWYLNGPGGYIVTAPPPGLAVSILPPFYTTLWLGGQEYYYADDVYYQWNPGLSAYVVVTPPTETVAETATPPPPEEQNPDDQLYIYPANGQSEQQQAQDRFDCYSWAKGQTNFDPTQPGGGVPADENADKHEQYRRAMTACLTARGYSVN